MGSRNPDFQEKKMKKKVPAPKGRRSAGPTKAAQPPPEPLRAEMIDRLEEQFLRLCVDNGTKAIAIEVFGLARGAFAEKARKA